MKLRYVSFFILSVVSCFIIADSYFNTGHGNPTGAPSARDGSVASLGLTCSECHSGGPNTIQPGWITSTIPASGYVPGALYTITATATYAGRSMFGFEISPENSAGVKKGTLIVTNSTTTQTISTGKYITHKQAGITGTSGSHTWSFNWTAPAVGTGTVTFYGAFLCANSSNNENGDMTYKSTLVATEDITTGLNENLVGIGGVSVFPNPAFDQLNVNYSMSRNGMVEITLYDLQGRIIAPLLSDSKTPGSYNDLLKLPLSLNDGVYFLEIATETSKVTKKILVQQ